MVCDAGTGRGDHLLLAHLRATTRDNGGDHRRSTRPVHHPRPDGGDTRRQQVRIYRSLDRRKDTALAKALRTQDSRPCASPAAGFKQQACIRADLLLPRSSLWLLPGATTARR